MKGLHDYIIEVKNKFNETFKTEGGAELYLDQRFSAEKLANRIAKVVSCPLLKESELQPGYEVLIDPTIFFQQKYEKHSMNDNGYLKDAEKGWYKIPSEMIVCYRETENDSWKGHAENLLVEFVKEEIKTPKMKSTLIITESKPKEFTKGIARVKHANKTLIEDEKIKEGDMIAIKHEVGIPFYLAKTLYWIRNRDVLAVITKN